MKQSESLKNLAAAMSKFQGQLESASKSKANPFFKSKYADIAEIWDTIKKPLADNGLSVVQLPSTNVNGEPTLVTTLLHESGEYMSAETPLIMLKKDPQAMGSAMTYFRRYALAACLGVVQDDDDGNAATQTKQKPMREDKLLHEQDKVSCFDFVIPIGQSKGKKFADLGPGHCEKFLEWIESQGSVNGPLHTTKIKLTEWLDSIAHSKSVS